MKISEAIDKLYRMMLKYGDIKVVQQSNNGGVEPINFYLKELKDGKIVVCTQSDGEFNPELGDEGEGTESSVIKPESNDKFKYEFIKSKLNPDGSVDVGATHSLVASRMAALNPRDMRSAFINDVHGALPSIDNKWWVIVYSDVKSGINSVTPKELYERMISDGHKDMAIIFEPYLIR